MVGCGAGLMAAGFVGATSCENPETAGIGVATGLGAGSGAGKKDADVCWPAPRRTLGQFSLHVAQW